MRHLKKKIAAAEGKLQVSDQDPTNEGEVSNTQNKQLGIKEEAFHIKEEAEPNSILSNKKGENINLLALKANQIHDRSDQDSSNDSFSDGQPHTRKGKLAKSSVDSKGAKGATSAKNIIKNYGRALHNFAISNMSLPYIGPLLDREKQNLKDFRKFFYSKKKQVRSIAGLRTLILVMPEDNLQIAAFKRVFQALSIIFIKFFSVNWIFSGKLFNKLAHLKCRFKMLRRIKSPENFTYLKGFL